MQVGFGKCTRCKHFRYYDGGTCTFKKVLNKPYYRKKTVYRCYECHCENKHGKCDSYEFSMSNFLIGILNIYRKG